MAYPKVNPEPERQLEGPKPGAFYRPLTPPTTVSPPSADTDFPRSNNLVLPPFRQEYLDAQYAEFRRAAHLYAPDHVGPPPARPSSARQAVPQRRVSDKARREAAKRRGVSVHMALTLGTVAMKGCSKWYHASRRGFWAGISPPRAFTEEKLRVLSERAARRDRRRRMCKETKMVPVPAGGLNGGTVPSAGDLIRDRWERVLRRRMAEVAGEERELLSRSIGSFGEYDYDLVVKYESDEFGIEEWEWDKDAEMEEGDPGGDKQDVEDEGGSGETEDEEAQRLRRGTAPEPEGDVDSHGLPTVEDGEDVGEHSVPPREVYDDVIVGSPPDPDNSSWLIYRLPERSESSEPV
jgi:hypothetical protein